MGADIQIDKLKELVQHSLEPVVKDIQPVEIQAIVSGLVTSIGLRAVNLAFEAKDRGETPHIESFSSRDGFDFSELSRTDLVHALDASSGLGEKACVIALAAIEEQVASLLAMQQSVSIERVGTFIRRGPKEVELCLDSGLSIPPDKKTSAKTGVMYA